MALSRNHNRLGNLVLAIRVREELIAHGALPIGFGAVFRLGSGDFGDLRKLMRSKRSGLTLLHSFAANIADRIAGVARLGAGCRLGIHNFGTRVLADFDRDQSDCSSGRTNGKQIIAIIRFIRKLLGRGSINQFAVFH